MSRWGCRGAIPKVGQSKFPTTYTYTIETNQTPWRLKYLIVLQTARLRAGVDVREGLKDSMELKLRDLEREDFQKGDLLHKLHQTWGNVSVVPSHHPPRPRQGQTPVWQMLLITCVDNRPCQHRCCGHETSFKCSAGLLELLGQLTTVGAPDSQSSQGYHPDDPYHPLPPPTPLL